MMKMTMRNMAALLLLCIGYAALAQINPVVEVNQSYKVSLSEIHKPVIKPAVADSLSRFDVSFDYSIFDRPYRDLYEFTPYQTAGLKNVDPSKYSHLLARVGMQYPLSPSAEIYTQLVAGEKFNLGLYGLHDSFFGKLPNMLEGVEPFDDRIDASRVNNLAGANLKYAWEQGEVSFGGWFHNQIAKDSIGRVQDYLRHRVNDFGLSFNLKSANPEENSLYYDFSIDYSYFDKKCETNGIEIATENMSDSLLRGNQLDARLVVGATYDIHRIYIDVHTKNIWNAIEGSGMGVVEFTPTYEITHGRLNAKIGAKFANLYGPEESTSIFPAINAKYEAIRNTMWLHAILGGGHQIISPNDILDDVVWYAPDCASLRRFSSKPLDASFAIETMIYSRLALNVNCGYEVCKDMLHLVPLQEVDCPLLGHIYTDYNHFWSGVQTSWKSRSFTISADFKYNSYRSPETGPTNLLPKFEAGGYAQYNWNRRFFASLNVDYFSASQIPFSISSPAEAQRLLEMPAFVDLGLSFDFILNRHFTFYVKGGNLLGRDNFRYPMVAEKPFNAGGGVYINF